MRCVMKLSDAEARFLTAVAREQNQSGCRGPAHDLLRKHGYPNAPRTGPGSLAFSYEVVPLISVVLQPFRDLPALDDFLRNEERIPNPEWPWASAEEFRARLEEARREVAPQDLSPA